VAGHQLLQRGAVRFWDMGVQQRGWGDHQQAGGLGVVVGWVEQQASGLAAQVT
jgi:hypothetical protein